MSEHTKGRITSNGLFIWFKDGVQDPATVAVEMQTVIPNSGIERAELDANARRLVAGWNMLERVGISTEDAERALSTNDLAIFAQDLMRDRDELLAGLLALEQAYSNKHSPQHRAACLAAARALLSKHQPGRADK